MKNDTTNKKFWQRMARLYAPLAEADSAFYEQLCGYIRPYLQKDWDVLELACGSGQLSFPLSDAARTWTATDFSRNMVAEAQKRGETETLHFAVADASALLYGNAAFDCVVIANALHIMPEPEKALRKIYRVLKPGGLLYAPTFLWADGKASKLRKRLMSLVGFRVYTEWNAEGFRAFLREQGFSVTEMHKVDGGFAPVAVPIAVKQ